MKKFDKSKGTLFWITGLSGSGKTTVGKNIHKDISKIYGPTILISGDDIRKIFDLKGYEYRERLKIAGKYSKYAKYITEQKINIILAVVGMFEEVRKWNRLNINNYVEIYIKSSIKNIIKTDKKKIYKKKNPGKLIGINIKPEYPKQADITITNNFKKSTNEISKVLLKKINILTNAKK
jgi:adenylylsulfate kinase